MEIAVKEITGHVMLQSLLQARVRALRIQQLEEERRAKMVAIRQEQAAIRDEVSRLTKLLTGGAAATTQGPPILRPLPSGTPHRAAAASTPLRSTGSALAQASSGPSAMRGVSVAFSPSAGGPRGGHYTEATGR